MMAERQLNINAPLLSVRRFSMKSSSSSIEEDGKVLGSSTPSRRHNVGSYRLDSVLDQVTEPVAVPFQWEQIPGRRKDGNAPAHELVEKVASVTPKLPPGRVLRNDVNDQCEDRPRLKALPVTENVMKLKSFGDGCDDDDGDDSDSFSDALDVLTMADSFSMTCSVSGLSSVDVKSTGSFSMEKQDREFMMSRFLPAAKAMTLQPKKPEEPRQDKMVEAMKRPPSPMKYGAFTIPHYGQDQEQGQESEDQDHDQDQDQDEEDYDTNSIAAKGCGLFSRLCLQNSMRLLNPMPGVKVKTRAFTGSKSEVERPVKAASPRTHIPTIKRDVAYKHKSGELPKLILKDVPYKYKSGELPKLNKKDVFYKHKSGELPKLTHKDVPYKHKSGELPKLTQKVTSGSQRFSFSGNLQTMHTLSPSRRSGAISPYRREAPQSPFRGSGFLGVPKEVESFKHNQFSSINKARLVDMRAKQGSGSATPTAEKTLYIDTVSFSDAKEQMGSADGDSNKNLDFSFQDAKFLDIVKDPGTLAGCEDLKVSDHQSPKGIELAIVKVGSEESLLPPPLPKSPSESWLWRTLPSANVQSSNSRTQFLRRKKDLVKPSTPNTKWETIVKTSNPRHDYARYSQELISHPSHPYKT